MKHRLASLIVLLLAFAPPSRAANPWIELKDAWVDLNGNPVAVETPHPEPGNLADKSPPLLCLLRTKEASSKGTFLVYPGGAYHGYAFIGEGLSAANFLNDQGYDVAILAYSHGPGPNGPGSEVRIKALQDSLVAVNLLQQKGEKLGLHTQTLGILGFSAGGHLTARTFHELGAASPFAKVILIYPAYLEIKPNAVAPAGVNDEVQPPEGAKARIFVVIGDMDIPSWVSSSQAYVDAAKTHGQEAEYHLLPGIKHAFNVRPGDAPTTAAFQKTLADFLAK
jgi:acetyl esterase/lipase